MKTLNKLIALVEIAIVLCSVFLVATLPAIAAEQNQEMQKASASEITTSSEDDYVLDIYGNANEDDTIDMRDLTYVKLIFFGKKPETELADAKYDGKINPLDFIQIKLIIVGKEKELTVVDDTKTDTYPDGKPVTAKKPINRIVATNSYTCEALRTLESKEKIVGISKSTATQKEFFPDISKLPSVGGMSPDIEKVLSLNPNLVIAYGSAYTKWTADLEDVLKDTDITLVRLDFYKPKTMTEDIRKLGYLLGKKDEAEEFIDFYEGYMNTLKERVTELSEDEKQKVYLETPSTNYQAYSQGSGTHQVCIMAGGINIAADLPGGEYIKVDPEWVVEQNPDIIVRQQYSKVAGYEVDDPSALEAVRDEIMNRPELAAVTAVKEGKVYCIGIQITNQRYFVGVTHMAKWFYPKLFEDLDPQAIHKEYLERFQGVPYKGIYVYPPLTS